MEPHTMTVHLAGDGDGLHLVLGPLEYALLRVAWRIEGGTLTDYHLGLRRYELQRRSLTTVQTTLNRLAEKGLLVRSGRRGGGRRPAAYRYAPACSEAAFRQQVIDALLGRLITIADPALVAERLAAISAARLTEGMAR